jgi:inosose dehydratase
MQLGYHSITWGGVKGAPQGVTSLKDCYYVTYGSMPRAVQDIAAASYTGTEIFDGDLLPYAEEPAELLDLLNEHGIELVSVYTGGTSSTTTLCPTNSTA